MRIIIIGGSKVVYFLARRFVQRKDHVTIINRDPGRSKELAEQTKATVILGEGTSVQRLEEAGARKADILLALTGHDQDNLIACQIAQKFYAVPRTIALVNDPDNAEIFHRLGVDVTFSATSLIVSLIDQRTSHSEIISSMPLAQGRINVTDIQLDEESPVIGKTLQELKLARGSLIACIIRGEEVIVPHGATRLQINDQLLLITHPEHQEVDLQILCGID